MSNNQLQFENDSLKEIIQEMEKSQGNELLGKWRARVLQEILHGKALEINFTQERRRLVNEYQKVQQKGEENRLQLESCYKEIEKVKHENLKLLEEIKYQKIREGKYRDHTDVYQRTFACLPQEFQTKLDMLAQVQARVEHFNTKLYYFSKRVNDYKYIKIRNQSAMRKLRVQNKEMKQKLIMDETNKNLLAQQVEKLQQKMKEKKSVIIELQQQLRQTSQDKSTNEELIQIQIQRLKGKYKKKYQLQLKNKDDEIDALNNNLIKLQQELSQNEDKLQSLYNELQIFQQENTKIKDDNNQMDQKIDILQKTNREQQIELDSLRKSSDNYTNQLKNDIENLQARLNNIQIESKNQIKSLKQKQKKELEILQDQHKRQMQQRILENEESFYKLERSIREVRQERDLLLQEISRQEKHQMDNSTQTITVQKFQPLRPAQPKLSELESLAEELLSTS